MKAKKPSKPRIKKVGNAEYQLRLYVTGATPNSLRAITNIRNICEAHLQGKYSLQIIDVYQEKEVAMREQLIALPLLVKTFPLPQRKLLGDLSQIDKVMSALGLNI